MIETHKNSGRYAEVSSEQIDAAHTLTDIVSNGEYLPTPWHNIHGNMAQSEHPLFTDPRAAENPLYQHAIISQEECPKIYEALSRALGEEVIEFAEGNAQKILAHGQFPPHYMMTYLTKVIQSGRASTYEALTVISYYLNDIASIAKDDADIVQKLAYRSEILTGQLENLTRTSDTELLPIAEMIRGAFGGVNLRQVDRVIHAANTGIGVNGYTSNSRATILPTGLFIEFLAKQIGTGRVNWYEAANKILAYISCIESHRAEIMPNEDHLGSRLTRLELKLHNLIQHEFSQREEPITGQSERSLKYLYREANISLKILMESNGEADRLKAASIFYSTIFALRQQGAPAQTWNYLWKSLPLSIRRQAIKSYKDQAELECMKSSSYNQLNREEWYRRALAHLNSGKFEEDTIRCVCASASTLLMNEIDSAYKRLGQELDPKRDRVYLTLENYIRTLNRRISFGGRDQLEELDQLLHEFGIPFRQIFYYYTSIVRDIQEGLQV